MLDMYNTQMRQILTSVKDDGKTYLQAIREVLNYDRLIQIPDHHIGHLEVHRTGSLASIVVAVHLAPREDVPLRGHVKAGGNVGAGLYMSDPSFYIFSYSLQRPPTHELTDRKHLLCFEMRGNEEITIPRLTSLVNQLLTEHEAPTYVSTILRILSSGQLNRWGSPLALITEIAKDVQGLPDHDTEITLQA